MTSEAEPSPEPVVQPVVGARTVILEAVDAGPIVFHDRPPPEPDRTAIDAFATQVGDWLDAHLTDLQAGGDGRLDEVAAPGLLDGDPATVLDVTAELTGPDRPVTDALYHVVVSHEGAPIWARVTVLVGTEGGATARVGFVFEPGPRLVAAGPHPEVTA